jgi:CRP-like cAMP-binding protein
MNDLNAPRQNHLLDALSEEEYQRLFPYLERVQVKTGDCIHEPGDHLRYAFFPATCIVSLLSIMEDGLTCEIAMVGNEGMIGVALFMGGGGMPNRAVALSTGYAYRLRRQSFIQEFNRNGPMFHLLLRYSQALMTHIAQKAVCNRHHTIDQQLCHWLLLNLDRIPGNKLILTQDLIASMLGVRREGVTEAAGKLQRVGLIDYRRGHITVLDRPGLKDRSCECYQVTKSEFDRLLPTPARRNSLILRLQTPSTTGYH